MKKSKADKPDAKPAPAAASTPALATPGWSLIQELNTDTRLRKELRALLQRPEQIEMGKTD
jgi:hypothetical protein